MHEFCTGLTWGSNGVWSPSADRTRGQSAGGRRAQFAVRGPYTQGLARLGDVVGGGKITLPTLVPDLHRAPPFPPQWSPPPIAPNNEQAPRPLLPMSSFTTRTHRTLTLRRIPHLTPLRAAPPPPTESTAATSARRGLCRRFRRSARSVRLSLHLSAAAAARPRHRDRGQNRLPAAVSRSQCMSTALNLTDRALLRCRDAQAKTDRPPTAPTTAEALAPPTGRRQRRRRASPRRRATAEARARLG